MGEWSKILISSPGNLRFFLWSFLIYLFRHGWLGLLTQKSADDTSPYYHSGGQAFSADDSMLNCPSSTFVTYILSASQSYPSCTWVDLLKADDWPVWSLWIVALLGQTSDNGNNNTWDILKWSRKNKLAYWNLFQNEIVLTTWIALYWC